MQHTKSLDNTSVLATTVLPTRETLRFLQARMTAFISTAACQLSSRSRGFVPTQITKIQRSPHVHRSSNGRSRPEKESTRFSNVESSTVAELVRANALSKDVEVLVRSDDDSGVVGILNELETVIRPRQGESPDS